MKSRLSAILGFLVLSSLGFSAKRPNVILILTDDLGYSDISCYGAKKVKTPHIDQLATNGIRFTHFHTGASICSPSRAAFLTGAYPQRTGLYMGINPNRTAHWFLGLNPDEITLAEHFQTKDYATHMVGKWHLGTEPEFLPHRQGFETYYGMPCNFSHSPKFFDNDKLVFQKTPLAQSTRAELGEFMQRGTAQRPTGSLFPEVPVISHEKDWNTINPEVDRAIAKERVKRHPDFEKPRRKRK